MKRILSFAHLDGVRPKVKSDIESIKVDNIASETERVFDFIYAPNPITGLPQNALGVFLSDDAPEAIRDFIRKNLIAVGEMPSVPDGIPVSDMETLCRGRYETVDEYCNKVNTFMQGIKEGYADKVKEWNRIKGLERQRIQERKEA